MAKQSTVNLLEAAPGTRFAIPSWFDLEALRVFISGLDSEDESDSGDGSGSDGVAA